MNINFPKIEEEVLARWKKEKTFEKSVQKRKNSKRFVFYEGPPTANGKPGIHHVMGRVFKDIILRYKTMRGFFVPRRAGWDTHGLPVELQIEKKLGLKSKKEIEQYGIAQFNKECKQSVWEYKKEWESLTERIGFWIDMKNPYVTYETSYIETLWFIIKQFWQKKLLYKDYKVVPWCTRCGTVLSSHELAQGYKTVTENAVFVKFLISNSKFLNTYLLAWTTTPWTLLGNVALAVGKDIEYVLAQKDNEQYILAKDLVQKVLGECQIIKTLSGKDLVGLEYRPLFDIKALKNEASYRVYDADFVTTTEGTGVVHTAVMYGEDDYALGKRVGLPQYHTVDERGKFTNEVPGGLAGLFVKAKETEEKIFAYLKGKGNFLAIQPYSHEYPFCWRCSTPLLYYAKESWFLNMQSVKKELLANNKKVNWVPAHLKEGRMGEWLKEVKDWAFSRERYWGTPLPIWQCEKCKAIEFIGSVADLQKKKFSSNSYYIVRHGYSEKQTKKVISSWPETMPFPLTEKGIKQAQDAAKELKKKRIDVIVSSDLLRTKQTAEIIGKKLGVDPIFDERLRELGTGILNGKPETDIGKYMAEKGETHLEHFLRRFEKPMPEGENWVDVQKRMYDFMKDTRKKYAHKNILIVSHELPLTLLEGLMRGFSRNELVEFREKKAMETGQWRALPFALFPYNSDMEIDLHRPYIDEVEFMCSKCPQGKMKRIKEVADVWFDSGAMPFAQNHWQGGKPELFPADYIVEGIDQTRGWFYTLLAVSTLLGFDAPYKNVISFSHVLDEKGEKMSKSKGNVVDPWGLIEKYGIDAVRWYFYTVNNPADPKLFSEKDVQQSIRNFLLTFWNCYVFLETYGKAGKAGSVTPKSKNILDRWILARLSETVRIAANFLDAYDITSAARAIEQFTVNDVSLWYVRRSRRRFQQPKNAFELTQASEVLSYVLKMLVLVSAPFIPFLSEEMYQRLHGYNFKKAKSVHFELWPYSKHGQKKPGKVSLNLQMEKIRALVTIALAERTKAGIKIRQPLASLKIKDARVRSQKELLDLLRDEVNVKEILFDPALSKEAEFDVRITPELKEEGIIRELMRQVQGMRKEAGYAPSDKAMVFCAGDAKLCGLISKEIKNLAMQETASHTADATKEIEIEGKKLVLGVKKI